MAIPKPKVAVVGCGHGELDAIYATVEAGCNKKGWAKSDLDFVIINGDFQAMRNSLDLNSMSVPHRYRKMGDFHKYYSGEAQAPILTIVIGGNHEASNYFYELYHGGWLAPNIYYLGAAGVIRYGPWRITGLSGIYHPADYSKPHHERLPYDRDDIRSIYHVREYDVQKLLQIRSQVHIGLSHDWPAWVELFGDYKDLYNRKPHFFHSAKKDGLGSKPGMVLMNHLRPSYWFSGHMHIRFAAEVRYASDSIEDTIRQLASVPDTWKSQLPIFRHHSRGGRRSIIHSTRPLHPASERGSTSFLALDKHKSDDASDSWVELLELDLPEPPDAMLYSERTTEGRFALHYDAEWLAITRANVDALRLQDAQTLAVQPAKAVNVSSTALDEHAEWVERNIVEKRLLKVPGNFTRHAPTYDSTAKVSSSSPLEYPNSQTEDISTLLQIPNRFAISGSLVLEETASAEEGDWEFA